MRQNEKQAINKALSEFKTDSVAEEICFKYGWTGSRNFILKDIIDALKIAGDKTDNIYDNNYRITEWIENRYELNK